MGSDNNVIQPNGIDSLVAELRKLILSARSAVIHTVNTLQVVTNFEIGRRIVEHEQQGAERAKYGKKILKELSKKLMAEFGRDFSEDNLSNMRKFYLVYQERAEIFETTSGKFSIGKKGQIPFSQLAKSETPSRKSRPSGKQKTFTLSWSHYVFLMGLKNPDERSFYEIETERQKSVGLRNREHFVNTCLNPLLEAGFPEMTIPDKPRSSKQKYRLTAKGQAVVKDEDGRWKDE